MRRCSDCSADVEGDWETCPLCALPVEGPATLAPFPDVPLRFSRRRVLKTLFLSSIGIITASLLAQLFFTRELGGIGAARSVWMGVTAMWLVVLMAVRKRGNPAKSTVYVVVLVALVCLYWDYLGGWQRWSLDYAIPIVCASATIALLITARMTRVELGEHMLYTGFTVLLGLVPIFFLACGWVSVWWPSQVCASISMLALPVMLVTRGADILTELVRRFHL